MRKPPRNELLPFAYYDPFSFGTNKQRQVLVWKQSGRLTTSRSAGNPRDWGDKESLVFDTQETLEIILPLLPKDRRLIIEATMSNDVPGVNMVATRELERLHVLPQDEHPTIRDWYRWYQCKNLPELLHVFLKQGKPRMPKSISKHVTEIPWNASLGEALFALIDKELFTYRGIRQGLGMDEQPKYYPDGRYRQRNPNLELQEPMHMIEGRPTKELSHESGNTIVRSPATSRRFLPYRRYRRPVPFDLLEERHSQPGTRQSSDQE